jgi:plastocyanin
MSDSRRQFLAAAAAGVTGMLAGCGGDGSEPATEATETETEATATEAMATETESMETATEGSMETETESMGTETGTGTEGGVDQTVAVGADGLQFTPETFEISVGDTVRWEWEGSGHNVRPDDIPPGSDWSGTAGGDGDTYGSGHTHSHTFETAGEYSYYCAPHQGSGMTGSFTVTQ